MKLISWNVNGLRAALGKGFLDYVAAEDPDVICLQLPTQSSFHLLACYVETDWQKLEFPFSGESNCADTWMRTMKDGKIGRSLGCRGDRATGALGYGDVRVTMTT